MFGAARVKAWRAVIARRFGWIEPPDDVAGLTPAHFWAGAEQPFYILTDADRYALRVQEVSIKPYGGSKRANQFSVRLFGDEPAPNFSTMCRVSHAWLGERDLFVSRIQPSYPDDPPTFEISFT